MNDAQLVRGVQPPRRLLKNLRNFGEGKRAAPVQGLAQRFAFQTFHGDVRCAIISLGSFVNGHHVRVMNQPRGTRLVLEAEQELRVVEQFAVKNLERHGAIAHPHLLGEENRAHAALTEAADNAIAAGEASGNLRLGFRSLGGKRGAVART